MGSRSSELILNITFSFQRSCSNSIWTPCPPGGSGLNASIPITLQLYKENCAAYSNQITGFMGLSRRTFHLSWTINLPLFAVPPALPFLYSSLQKFAFVLHFHSDALKSLSGHPLLQLPVCPPYPFTKGTRLQPALALLGGRWEGRSWRKATRRQAAASKSLFKTYLFCALTSASLGNCKTM